MVISLGWLLPATSRGLPAAPTTRAGSRCLLGLAPTGGYRATPVARRAVGSYPTFSHLPLDKGRSVFCGPFRRLTAPRGYLAVCPMELRLSSARHSDRRTATITPYRHPGGKVSVLEGWRQASTRQPPHQADQTVARRSRAGCPCAPAPTACPTAPPVPPHPPGAPGPVVPPPPPPPAAPLPPRPRHHPTGHRLAAATLRVDHGPLPPPPAAPP